MDKFITFEGIEGCGKTTQIKMAGDYLSGTGIPVVLTEEPGGTAFGRKIRDIVLNRSSYDISAEAELLLFLSARAQHVRELIKPALIQNKIVLCDRFSDATMAYQGFGRGLNTDALEAMNAFAAASLKPLKTFLFDLPPEIGLSRAMRRISQLKDFTPKEDRFERETVAFHERVREGYLRIAKDDPDRFVIIDAAPDVHAVFDQVRSCLLPLVT
ncbi:MAG: dTMP kinase [Deltaproteobacteria bacterium]|nr:dTMP kinase [Deltaproteobacteria bacterium]